MVDELHAGTEAQRVDFFRRCYQRFLEARESAGGSSRCYRVGGTTVCLTFAGEDLVPHITPALEHLRVPNVDRADLTLCVWDSHSTSTQMVPPPCERESFTDRGEVWGFSSSRIKFAFHWFDYSVNLLDHATRTGIYWTPQAGTLPYWVQAAPLRTLFHWWMETHGCQLLHAAAVGTDEGAVLLTGKAGVGKSTAALSCLRAGLRYLADDYLIIRLEPEPLAYSLYCTAKLNADHLARFPEFRALVQNVEKLDREKAVLYLYPRLANRLATELPVRAMLIPRIVDLDETSVTPAPSVEIQRASAFTTMSQLPHVGRHTLDFIDRFASTVPGYTLEMGKDLNKIPTAISNLPAERPRPRQGRPAMAVPRSAAKPLVSAIIPVFNGEHFIKDAVQNVLSQDYPALELIVVDDGSTDRTEEIVSRLPHDIRYLQQGNAGPAAARNRGIRDAAGEIVAFLDVDDLWPENTLTLLVAELVRDPELEVVHGYNQLMVRNAHTGEYEYRGNPKETFQFSIGAGVYRKSVFARIGLFDSTLTFGEDNDWFCRARESGVKMRRVDRVTLVVRRHGSNMTQGMNGAANNLHVLKKALDRKRARQAQATGSDADQKR